MPIPIVHLNRKLREVKQEVRYKQNNKTNNQNSIIEHDSIPSSEEKIEHTNDIEFWSQNILPDGSCQRIYRDRSQYIKKPGEYEFKRVEDISKETLKKMKESEEEVCRLFFEATKNWNK